MKKITMAIAVLSLVMTGSIVGFGQGKSRARVQPGGRGNQICTGCCDPCYAEDVSKVRNQQSNTQNAKTTRTTNKSSSTPNARKGKR